MWHVMGVICSGSFFKNEYNEAKIQTAKKNRNRTVDTMLFFLSCALNSAYFSWKVGTFLLRSKNLNHKDDDINSDVISEDVLSLTYSSGRSERKHLRTDLERVARSINLLAQRRRHVVTDSEWKCSNKFAAEVQRERSCQWMQEFYNNKDWYAISRPRFRISFSGLQFLSCRSRWIFS